MPPTRKRTRVDVWYEVSGQNNLEARRGWMFPRTVQVMHSEGEPITVIVKGPMRTKNGAESTQRGQVIFGRFGVEMSQAPDWVRVIATEVEQMGGQQ